MQSQTRTRKLRRRRPTVISLRQSLVYQPLAILMAILMLPALSWVESGGAGARPFQASAQIQLQGCAATGNTIIRNYCANGVVYFTDLTQFEKDSVTAYLALHNIPQSDAHVIYDYGRSDLRSAVRGVMMTTLQGIFALPASQRTPHQQSLYDWMQGLVQSDEISMYQNALSSFRSWQADPCHFVLDPTIASVYNLTYDGNPYCFASETNVVGAQVPAEGYFTAYGLKKSYAAAGDTYPEFGKLVAAMGVNVGEVAGISTAAFDVLAGAAAAFGAAAYAAFSVAIAVYVVTGAGASAAVSLGPAIVAGAAGLTFASTVGAVLVPLLAVIVGVAAGVELFTNVQQINTINADLTNGLNNANTQPDLNAMATDTSGLGFYKLELALASQTVPEVASTAALPTHQVADLNFAIGPNVATTLSYKDWDGNTRSAQTWGGWFVQTCANGSGSTCDQADSIIASLRYKDWSGVKWTASRMGSNFVSIKASPTSTDTTCPADAVTLVTPSPDPTKCSSYVSKSIPLEDGNGDNVNVSFSVLAPPVFTSASTFAFGPSIPSSATITATGNPVPSIYVVSSSLPAANFTGVFGNGSFQLTFNGASDATQGNFPLVLQASNSAGSVQQSFNVNVSPQLAIISPASMNVTAGIQANFTVVATGNPTPALSMDPSFFLGGLTFTDNHNGTGTISGIYSSGGPKICEKIDPPGPCGIIATSTQGTTEQQFALNVSAPPQAVIPGCPVDLVGNAGDPNLNLCPGTTFYTNAPNQILLTTTGETTPVVSWGLSGWIPAVVPSWLSVRNNGDGTALLQGTPPLGTTGTFSVLLSPTAAYTTARGHIYPVTVVNAPIFTSPSTSEFTAGTAASFSISANIGTISLSSTLPNGLSFLGSGSNETIGGTPAPGTGGQYTLTLKDDAGTAGTAMQSLTLNVNEGPQITSTNTANMFVGMPGMFAVTTTGFPSVSNHMVPANPQPPTDPSQGDGMYFTVTGLPQGLQASNLNTEGFAGPTLTIQGTPTAAGTYPVQITAQNGVGQAAQQMLTLNIVQITGSAPKSGATCNGNTTARSPGTLMSRPARTARSTAAASTAMWP